MPLPGTIPARIFEGPEYFNNLEGTQARVAPDAE